MSADCAPVIRCDRCGRNVYGSPGQSLGSLRAELATEGWLIEHADVCMSCQQPNAEALAEACLAIEGAF